MREEGKLNFLSENFSAMDALLDDALLAPSRTLFNDSSYPLFDNIGKCRFVLPKDHPDFLDLEKKMSLPRQSEESKRKQVRASGLAFTIEYFFSLSFFRTAWR
jgi:hypothetical protein